MAQLIVLAFLWEDQWETPHDQVSDVFLRIVNNHLRRAMGRDTHFRRPHKEIVLEGEEVNFIYMWR